MNRFIIVNRKSKVYDGIYFCRKLAIQQSAYVRACWPGLEWEVEESACGFPVPGLIHMGEVRAKGILKRHMSDAQPAE